MTRPQSVIEAYIRANGLECSQQLLICFYSHPVTRGPICPTEPKVCHSLHHRKHDGPADREPHFSESLPVEITQEYLQELGVESNVIDLISSTAQGDQPSGSSELRLTPKQLVEILHKVGLHPKMLYFRPTC